MQGPQQLFPTNRCWLAVTLVLLVAPLQARADGKCLRKKCPYLSPSACFGYFPTNWTPYEVACGHSAGGPVASMEIAPGRPVQGQQPMPPASEATPEAPAPANPATPPSVTPTTPAPAGPSASRVPNGVRSGGLSPSPPSPYHLTGGR
jgi:hypothetical protein